MYPTTVIVLVNTQRSFVDAYGNSSAVLQSKSLDFKTSDERSRRATVGHLSFARGDGGGHRTHPDSNIFYTSIGDDVEVGSEKGESTPGISEDHHDTATAAI